MPITDLLTSSYFFLQRSANLNDRYDTAKEMIDEKQNMTGNVHERIQNLSKGAIDLFESALQKLQILEGNVFFRKVNNIF